MSPDLRGWGHIVFVVDLVGIGVDIDGIFLTVQHLVNWWLDSYQIFMDAWIAKI